MNSVYQNSNYVLIMSIPITKSNINKMSFKQPYLQSHLALINMNFGQQFVLRHIMFLINAFWVTSLEYYYKIVFVVALVQQTLFFPNKV